MVRKKKSPNLTKDHFAAVLCGRKSCATTPYLKPFCTIAPQFGANSLHC